MCVCVGHVVCVWGCQPAFNAGFPTSCTNRCRVCLCVRGQKCVERSNEPKIFDLSYVPLKSIDNVRASTPTEIRAFVVN